MKKIRFFAWATMLTGLIISSFASANLLIYPVRVSFNENQRSAEMTLTNTSSKTNTYRLEWRENRAQPEGGYAALTEEEAKGLPIASSMLRFSPRQVTLRPGQRQNIKLSLRRPRELADGEYRSHLLLKALPPKQTTEDKGATSMSINMVMSFAVPVSVQQGDYNVKIALNGAQISYNPDTKKGEVKVKLLRTGTNSSSGDMSAFWTPKGGKERLIAKIADYNVWAELDEVTANLIWTNSEFSPTDGRLRISYEGVREFRGNTYLDNTMNVKQADILINK